MGKTISNEVEKEDELKVINKDVIKNPKLEKL